MKLTNIFRLPSHKTFNYIPRYYDAKKEQEEKRKKELLDLVEIEKQRKLLEEKQVENQTQGDKKGYQQEYEKNYQQIIGKAYNIREREKIAINANQSIILVILVATCFGFWYFGTYTLWFIFPSLAWVVFRMKMKRGRKYDILDDLTGEKTSK